MKHLTPFEWSRETFEERIGEPEAFEAAVGKIAMNFSDLEHTVGRFVRYLTGLQPGRPTIDPVSLSFGRKVDLLASTVSELKDVLPFNTGPAPADEFFGELEHNCIQADALYRQIMGARWGGRRENGAIEMLGSDNSAGEQNEQSIGALNAHQLLDIADFICCVEMELDQFFLCPEAFIPEAA
jgi:hypothetical protein